MFPVNLSLHLPYERLERRFRKKNAGRSHRGDPDCEGETRGADGRRLIADAALRADSAAPAAAAAAAQRLQPTGAERDRAVGRRERERAGHVTTETQGTQLHARLFTLADIYKRGVWRKWVGMC